jgi:hypothetical protein
MTEAKGQAGFWASAIICWKARRLRALVPLMASST